MSPEIRPALPKEQAETRIEELATKEEITTEELKELVYHLWHLEPSDEGEPEYDGELMYPNKENPAVKIYVAKPEDNFVTIDFPDRLGEETGEEIRFTDNEDGPTAWYAGTYGSFYSEFLGRRILSHAASGNRSGSILADEPLTPKEMHKVAELLFVAYKLSQTQIPPEE